MIGIWPEATDKPPYLYGAFGDYVYIEPFIPVLKLPDQLTPEEMVMIEPLDVAVHVWARALASSNASYASEGVDLSQTLVIMGSGPIGMSALTVALVNGMEKVVMIDPIQERLEVAKKVGAKYNINPKDFDTIEKRRKEIEDLTYGVGADVVIEAAGEVPAFEESFKLLRRGGTLVEMGHFTYKGDATVSPHHDFCNKDIQVFGSWAHTFHDMKVAISVAEKAKELGIPFGKIVAEVHPVEEIAECIERLEARVAPGKIATRP
jgi:L-iditol 2-dehydrogenase